MPFRDNYVQDVQNVAVPGMAMSDECTGRTKCRGARDGNER